MTLQAMLTTATVVFTVAFCAAAGLSFGWGFSGYAESFIVDALEGRQRTQRQPGPGIDWAHIRAAAHSLSGYAINLGIALAPWCEELLAHKDQIPPSLKWTITGAGIISAVLHHYSGSTTVGQPQEESKA